MALASKFPNASRPYHNFVKISGAHRMTPAQAAGVDSRLWEIDDIVRVVEEWEATDAGKAQGEFAVSGTSCT
jgi:hypothetical protein